MTRQTAMFGLPEKAPRGPAAPPPGQLTLLDPGTSHAPVVRERETWALARAYAAEMGWKVYAVELVPALIGSTWSATFAGRGVRYVRTYDELRAAAAAE